jgi:hypothetical protein
MVNRALPNTTIWFLSLKPSFARKKNLAAQQEANRMLRELAGKNNKTRFIDITGLMYDRQGNLRGDLFEADSLHVNKQCYHDWARKMKKEMRLRK